jgi:hypothetical protein
MNIYAGPQGKQSRHKGQTEFYKQPPYIFGFERGKQAFYYIGSFHAHDPEHPQFGILRLYWDAFVQSREVSECITLVEGGERKVHQSLEETIKNEGEASWMVWHSQQAGVTHTSPEPDQIENTHTLIDEYGRDAVLHYYFVRELAQWHRNKPLPDYERYFSFVKQWPRQYGLSGSLSLTELETIHEKITGQTFDRNQADYFYKLSDPHEQLTVTNNVSRRCTKLRDEHIIGQIKKYWDEGKSIFAVYGFSHVIDQEPELKRLLRS